MKPIWIVDDDQSIRWVLEKALARESLLSRSFTNVRDVLAALEDDDYVNESVALNRAGMVQMAEGLTRLGYDFIPSAGNFVAFDSAEPGHDLFQRMLQEGVIVRAIAEYGLPNHVRVSVGLESENERFLSVLAKVGSHAPPKSTPQAES